MMHVTRFVPPAACLAGILGILAAVGGCSRPDAESKAQAQGEANTPTETKAGAQADAHAMYVAAENVVCAETQRLESGLSFTGELQPTQIVEVNCRFDGDLDRVLVREGQAVRRGQALAMYRPRDVQDRLRSAEAQVLAATAAFKAAENAEKRARRLFEAGAASGSDLELAEAQRTAARAGLDQAEELRNSVREDEEKLDVPSPISGWISRVDVHGGDRTMAGDPLFQVVDTDTLELSATVPSEALGLVRPGALIRFRVDAYPDEVFEGTISRVNPTTEPGTRQLRIYTYLANPEGKLVGGLFASGRVIDQIRPYATTAPLAVIRNEGTEQVVYRLRGGRAERVSVTMGIVDNDAGLCELTGSIAPGDSLLTGVLPGLRSGVQVTVLGRLAENPD